MSTIPHSVRLNAVDLAVKHIASKGSDDIYRPPAFARSPEFSLIQRERGEFEKFARKEALSFLKTADLTQKPIGRAFFSLVVKGQASYRRVAMVDPIDSTKFLALTLTCFPQIDAPRIPKGENVVHSHRRADNPDTLFDDAYDFSSFKRASSQLTDLYAQRNGWTAITDIANFFDRIGNHPLENGLYELGCYPAAVKLLREVLFYWSGDRRSYGIPVGSDSSRILSEVPLTPIDRRLKEHGIQFVRYVDDYRIFGDTRSDCLDGIRLLTELLDDQGLSLNAGKTEVVPAAEKAALFEEEEDLLAEHEEIDTKTAVVRKKLLRISGHNRISKEYRYPGRELLKRLKGLDPEETLRQISIGAYDSETRLRDLVKYFVYYNQDIEILKRLVLARATSIIYIADALIKEDMKVAAFNKAKIILTLVDILDFEKLPYPLKLPLLRLAAHEGYYLKALSSWLIDKHRYFDDHVFLREALAFSIPVLDRRTIRDLARRLFPASPVIVQRMIARALIETEQLEADEKRPIIRNLKVSTDDWFSRRLLK